METRKYYLDAISLHCKPKGSSVARRMFVAHRLEWRIRHNTVLRKSAIYSIILDFNKNIEMKIDQVWASIQYESEKRVSKFEILQNDFSIRDDFSLSSSCRGESWDFNQITISFCRTFKLKIPIYSFHILQFSTDFHEQGEASWNLKVHSMANFLPEFFRLNVSISQQRLMRQNMRII